MGYLFEKSTRFYNRSHLIDSFWSNKLTALFFQFLITALLALQRNLMQGENDHRFSLTRKMSSYIYNFFLHGVGKIAINLFSFFRNCSWKTNMFWIEFVTRNILFNSWKKISKQFFFFKILVSKIFFKNLPATDFKKTFCDHIYIFLWNMSYQNGSSMFQVYNIYLQIKMCPTLYLKRIITLILFLHEMNIVNIKVEVWQKWPTIQYDNFSHSHTQQ